MVDPNQLLRKVGILAKVFEQANICIVKRPFDKLNGSWPNVSTTNIHLKYPPVSLETDSLDSCLKKNIWDVIFIQGMTDSIWSDPYYQVTLFPFIHKYSLNTLVCYLTSDLKVLSLNEELINWHGPIFLPSANLNIDCPGHMSAEELDHMISLVQESPDSKFIIEIGRYFGRATIALAYATKQKGQGRLVSIDWYEQHTFSENLTRHGLSEFVEVWNCFSMEGYNKWMLDRTEEKPGLVFIDGGHTYEDAYMGILKWSLLLPPGGIIAVDDYDEHNMGVLLAANRLIIWSDKFHDLQVVGKLLTARKNGY